MFDSLGSKAGVDCSKILKSSFSVKFSGVKVCGGNLRSWPMGLKGGERKGRRLVVLKSIELKEGVVVDLWFVLFRLLAVCLLD